MDPSNGNSLRATYETLDPSKPLGDDVLAAVVFGADAPCPDDPRCLRIDLQPLGSARWSEVWRCRGPTRIGTAGPIRYVEDGEHFAGWLTVDENRFGGLLEASEASMRWRIDSSSVSMPPNRFWFAVSTARMSVEKLEVIVCSITWIVFEDSAEMESLVAKRALQHSDSKHAKLISQLDSQQVRVHHLCICVYRIQTVSSYQAFLVV